MAESVSIVRICEILNSWEANRSGGTDKVLVVGTQQSSAIHDQCVESTPGAVQNPFLVSLFPQQDNDRLQGQRLAG